MAQDDDPNLETKTYLLLLAFALAGFVGIIYKIIRVAVAGPGDDGTTTYIARWREAPNNIGRSTVELIIPAYKFEKGPGLAREDGMCAVCLSEYEDGEELRALPGCMHSFHVPCIDMWLYSHSACPVCRTDMIFPSP